MSDNKKIIIVVICIAVLAAPMGYFWLRHRVRVVKRANRLKRLKELKGKKVLPELVIPGATKEVSHKSTRAKVIGSIADLLLKDFIACCVHDNLGVLGTGTEEELQAAFTNLLSQYYEVKNDERVKYEVKLRKDIATLELRKYNVEVLCSILKDRYSVAAADGLRRLYLHYELTEETLARDLAMIGKAEISKSMEYERARTKLESLYGQKQNDKKESPEKQYRNFMNRLMDINKAEGVRYDMQTISVMEFAIAEARLMDHITNLKVQANGRR